MSKKVFLAAMITLAMLPLSVASAAAAQAVPSGTNMRIRLETPLSTRVNREGDPFTATVLEPDRFSGCRIRGHVRSINQSGRLSGRTEMSLGFDSIKFQNGPRQPFRASVDNVLDSDTVKIVDNEGRIISGSRSHQAMERSGIGAAVGGVLGGALGGGKGALLGVMLGAGAGAGSLYAQGAREIRLDPGTEIEITTEYEGRPRALARTDWEQDQRLVESVQNSLRDQGYDPGNTDGRMSWRTREAIRNFQRDQGLPVTGSIDEMTANRLGVR